VSCSGVRCVAVCCSVLQCVAVCCSVLQCVAVCCRVLRKAAVEICIKWSTHACTRTCARFIYNCMNYICLQMHQILVYLGTCPLFTPMSVVHVLSPFLVRCSVLQNICSEHFFWPFLSFLTAEVLNLYTFTRTLTLTNALTYTHTHTHTHTNIQTYIHTYIQTYRHTCIQTYIHTYVQTYRHTDIHTDKHTCR